MTEPTEYGLGRIHAPDPRDKAYPMRVSAQAAAAAPRSRTWYSRGVLDQGPTSQCVAYAGSKYLTSSPVINKRPDEAKLYHECQLVDEFYGEEPIVEGTSVRALFKVLQKRGCIQEYRWAFDAETVVAHVLAIGPVVCGTNWYMGMFDGDSHGYISPTGNIAGGHAWLVLGANRDRKNPDGRTGAVRILNSWGSSWNGTGRCWMTFKDLDRLIKEDGEACVSTERLAVEDLQPSD